MEDGFSCRPTTASTKKMFVHNLYFSSHQTQDPRALRQMWLTRSVIKSLKKSTLKPKRKEFRLVFEHPHQYDFLRIRNVNAEIFKKILINFQQINSAEIWRRIKPDHHPIFPSLGVFYYNHLTLQCNGKNQFGMPKNGSLRLEF